MVGVVKWSPPVVLNIGGGGGGMGSSRLRFLVRWEEARVDAREVEGPPLRRSGFGAIGGKVEEALA